MSFGSDATWTRCEAAGDAADFPGFLAGNPSDGHVTLPADRPL